jgi:hypothetical protein
VPESNLVSLLNSGRSPTAETYVPLRLLLCGEPSTVVPVKARSVPEPMVTDLHRRQLKVCVRHVLFVLRCKFSMTWTDLWKSVNWAAALLRSSSVMGVMSYPDLLNFGGVAPGVAGCQPCTAPCLLAVDPMPCAQPHSPTSDFGRTEILTVYKPRCGAKCSCACAHRKHVQERGEHNAAG